MTKAELIQAITRKIRKADPIIRDDLIKSLHYKRKAILERYLHNVRVDKDGKGIRL